MCWGSLPDRDAPRPDRRGRSRALSALARQGRRAESRAAVPLLRESLLGPGRPSSLSLAPHPPRWGRGSLGLRGRGGRRARGLPLHEHAQQSRRSGERRLSVGPRLYERPCGSAPARVSGRPPLPGALRSLAGQPGRPRAHAVSGAGVPSAARRALDAARGRCCTGTGGARLPSGAERTSRARGTRRRVARERRAASCWRSPGGAPSSALAGAVP